MFRTLTQHIAHRRARCRGRLAGCASLPQPQDDGALQREAMAGTQNPPPAPLPLNTGMSAGSDATAKPEISTGSGQFIQPGALATPRPGGQAAMVRSPSISRTSRCRRWSRRSSAIC